MAEEGRGWGKIMAIIGAVGIVVTGLAAVGLQLPQIATQDHIEKHAGEDEARYIELVGEVKSLKAQMLTREIESNELRELRLLEEVRKRKEAGEPTITLDGEIRILKQRTRSAQETLDGLRK